MSTTFSCDETPTPTRLIQNFDAAGLFQDLQQHNPFEETFRNAAANNDISNLLKNPVPKTVTEETLNTPRVLPRTKTNNYPIFPDEDDTVNDFLEPILPDIQYIDCLRNDINSEESSDIEMIEECRQDSTAENSSYLSTLDCNREDPKSVVYHSPRNKVSIVKDFLFDSNSLQTTNGDISDKLVNESSKQTVNVINNKKSIQNGPNKSTTNLVMSPVTNLANVGTFIKLENVQKSTNSTGNVVYNVVNSNASVPKMIDGKKIIIIPSKPLKSDVKFPVFKLSPKKTAVCEPILSAKEKLKTMLCNGNSSQRLNNVEKSNDLEDVIIVSDSAETKDTSSVGSPDDKREHSRERNRIAQKRCRLKKKKWISQLKNETEVVVAKNHKLQNEISSLKAEIAHLKTLLLAHRNCSVTRAMYKADLNAILNNDVSDIVEDIEIPAADDLEDTNTNGSQITINNQFTNNQIHQHLHLHVPLSSSSPNLTDSELSLAPDVQQIEQPSLLLRQLSNLNSQFDRSKKLICDSKVVPIKPTDRSLNKCYQKRFRSSDSKILTTRNTQDETDTATAETVKKPTLKIFINGTETS